MIAIFSIVFSYEKQYIVGLVQERHNTIANAQEFHLSCTNPSIWEPYQTAQWLKQNNFCCIIIWDAIFKMAYDPHYSLSFSQIP